MPAGSAVTCRLFEAEDLPALFAVEEVCFPPSVRFSRALTRSLTIDPHCHTWIGIVDNIRAGFAMVGLRGEDEPTTAYIWTIEVLPAFRRMGVATSLLECAVVSAREAGCAAIALHVDEKNQNAIALYERAGFVQTGIDFEFYGHGQNALCYRRDLSAGR